MRQTLLPRVRAVDRYIIQAMLPYIFLALAVLSVILLIQQSTKFAEVLGSSEAPLRLALDVSFNLLPGILMFTLPMSVLVGTATGFSRMAHDSELTAMRAAGVGTLRIVAPALILGCALSLLALYVGFNVAPASAQNLRDIALQAALYKLESPVEPRSFYTGIPGKTIYVREGDKQSGQWGKIFIHWQEPDGQTRLVTARAGRLDFSGDQTELVLDDALITTLPAGGVEAIERGEHVTIERSANTRLRDDRLNFGRSTLARRVREREPELDEMGWGELLRKSKSAVSASERREAEIALNKRLTLGLSPIIFAFFGACLGVKVVRGGRSQGMLLSLGFMLIYYLISLAGEQLGRAGIIAPFLGPWLPFCFSVALGGLLLTGRRRAFANPFGAVTGLKYGPVQEGRGGSEKRFSTPFGLLDKSIFRSLTRNFLLTLSALVFVFLIFTVSELLRFIAQNHVSPSIVTRYLLYLLPFTFNAVAPVSTLLSVLITFALMVRRNETVAWWSGGQSIFRLILSCVFFAVILGAVVWFVQDKVMPVSNRKQNALRGMIRTGAIQAEAQPGRIWVSSADSGRIYTYDPVSVSGQLSNLVLFDFDRGLTNLESITISPAAVPVSDSLLRLKEAEVISLSGQSVTYSHSPDALAQAADIYALNSSLNRPSEFDFTSLSAYIKALKSRGVNVQPLAVALERKRAEPFFPLVMTLVGAPLAFVFGRRGTLMALCITIGAGLLFLGLMNFLQELGARGLLSPPVAAWSPSFLFLAGGIYLLSRSRT